MVVTGERVVNQLEDGMGRPLGRHIHMTDRVRTTPRVVISAFLALHVVEYPISTDGRHG